MLNFLSQGNQKQIVGISLTPGIGLEAVIVDKFKNVVLNYGRKKVEYNFSTREIQDYIQFKTAIVELMDEMKIPPKALTYLVLPNVHFDFTQVPSVIGDAELKTVVLSKAEEFYLFKREEPVSGCYTVSGSNDVSTKKIAYTSFQKTAIDQIKDIISDCGLQLIGIESAYSATIRGLHVTGLIDDVVLEESSWTLMMINTNSFTLFQMEGKNLLDCTEVPLAIKSFSTEEAYQAIVSSSSQLLNNYPSMKLYIISQTDDICADVLKRQMQYDREIVAIDSNKYSKKPMLDVMAATDFNEANSITASVLGASIIAPDFITLNVLSDDPAAYLGIYFTTKIAGQDVDVTSDFVIKACVALAVVVGVFFGAIGACLNFVDVSAQDKLSQYKSEIQSIDAQISSEEQGEKAPDIDMFGVIDQVAASNVVAINFYDSIATDIPKNVWLTKYYNKAGDKILIKGIAENIADIYEYYKNLRVVSPQSNIKLTELKVLTDVSGESEAYISNLLMEKDFDRLYSFEIANTDIEIVKEELGETSEIEIIKKKAPEADNKKEIEKPSKQMKLAR